MANETTFRDAGLSFFRGRHSMCKILQDGRNAKNYIFPCEMRLQSAKSNLGEQAGAR